MEGAQLRTQAAPAPAVEATEGGSVAGALGAGSGVEVVQPGRNARKRQKLSAELQQLTAEEKARAKEERVEAAGRRAYLASMLDGMDVD